MSTTATRRRDTAREAKLTPELKRLVDRLHRELGGWGGQDDEARRNMRSWFVWCVLQWRRAEQKRRTP